MRPWERIQLRLLGVESLRLNQPFLNFEDRAKTSRPHLAKVLHISNCAHHSFITEKLLRKLLLMNWNSNCPVIDIDNDTIVRIQWHYPDLKYEEVTTHLVVNDDRFEIILRREDWEGPIRDLIHQKSPEYMRCNRTMQPHPAQRGENPKSNATESRTIKAERTKQAVDVDGESDTEPESELASSGVFSRTSTTSTATSRPDEIELEATENNHECEKKWNRDEDIGEEPVQNFVKTPIEDHRVKEVEDDDEDEGWYNSETSGVDDDESDFGEVEMCEVDPQADSPGMQEEAYWTWDSDEGRWCHQDNDGSPKRWFPAKQQGLRINDYDNIDKVKI